MPSHWHVLSSSGLDSIGTSQFCGQTWVLPWSPSPGFTELAAAVPCALQGVTDAAEMKVTQSSEGFAARLQLGRIIKNSDTTI